MINSVRFCIRQYFNLSSNLHVIMLHNVAPFIDLLCTYLSHSDIYRQCNLYLRLGKKSLKRVALKAFLRALFSFDLFNEHVNKATKNVIRLSFITMVAILFKHVVL